MQVIPDVQLSSFLTLGSILIMHVKIFISYMSKLTFPLTGRIRREVCLSCGGVDVVLMFVPTKSDVGVELFWINGACGSIKACQN